MVVDQMAPKIHAIPANLSLYYICIPQSFQLVFDYFDIKILLRPLFYIHSLIRWMEVILDQLVVQYLTYEIWDSEHLVSDLISNGDLIFTILIQFCLN